MSTKRTDPQASLLPTDIVQSSADAGTADQLPAIPDRSTAIVPRVDYVGGTLDLIKTAIDKGIDADSLGKLLDLQDRVLAKDAERQFSDGMRAFQAECAFVGKNRLARILKKGSTEVSHEYWFADLAQVAEKIKPFCEKYGFSYRFNQRSTSSGMIEVDCIVRHVAGHSETTTFALPTESPAAMTSQQKFGGATTFGRRYALCLAFGLTIGEDNDGNAEHPKPEQTAGAPQPRTRGERQGTEPPPEDDQPAVTGKMLKNLLDEWKTQQAGTPTADDYVAWVTQTTGRTFNTLRPSEWTASDFAKCAQSLGMPE